ncbi:HAD-like protein [Lactarius deliciosus]|nr:HAD-like protein [Lactarius deliciosus]
MSESLSQFKALIFDVYGTLVNWESGILTALSPLITDPGQEWSKSDILFAFSTVESDLQVKSPTALYSDILAAVYDELSRLGRSTQRGQLDTTAPDRAIVSGSGDPGRGTVTQSHTHIGSSSPDAIPIGQMQHSPAATAFAASLAQWPIFPDTPAALARLSALGLKLAVLSNVDRASFAHTRTALERQGGFAFDAVYTAEDVGSYKSVSAPSTRVDVDRHLSLLIVYSHLECEYRPDPRNFEYAVAQLRADDPTLQREQILVVAQSLPHDHVPARALGLSSVWIDRPDAVTCIDGNGVPKERAAKEAFAKWRFRDLREFADVVEEARAKHS